MTFPMITTENSALHRGLRLSRVAVVVAVVFALPHLVAPYRLDEVTGALILATAAVGLNVLSGFGGQISMGHAAFFGIGAYTTGILITRYELPAPLAFIAGMCLCFIVGVLVGMPALRLQGMYLALVTLAVGVIFPSLVRRFESLTGGSAGLFGVSYEPPAGAYFAGRAGQVLWLYWVAVVALGLSCLLVWNLMRGRMGRAVVALRDNESAAIVMGVDRTIVRTVLFGISAAIAGLAGGLFAVDTGILTPESFSLLVTIYLLVAMVLGGRASYWGPVVGGFAIYYIPLWTAEYSEGPLAGVIFGVIVILMVFTMRHGVVGFIKDLGRRVLVVEPRPPIDPVALSTSARPPTAEESGQGDPTPAPDDAEQSGQAVGIRP